MVEIHHLRCFVAVAEELHFGRAAERLGMTQPPLSRQVQSLEHLMHCELFARNSRAVRLTRAGEAFFPEAQRILRLLSNAQGMVSDLIAGRRGLVRCGFTAASAYEILPAMISAFKRENPDVSLSLREMVSTRQIEALAADELDIGIFRPPIESTTFEAIALRPEPMVVAMPVGHPLAEKQVVAWKDLDSIEMVGFESQEGRYLHNLLAGKFLEHDISPRITHRLSQIHSILALVRAGLGVALVPNSAKVLNISTVQYRDIEKGHAAYAKLSVVWNKDTDNPLVKSFVESARLIN
jgi:DNA-binding transcriptional LysR family regulator